MLDLALTELAGGFADGRIPVFPVFPVSRHRLAHGQEDTPDTPIFQERIGRNERFRMDGRCGCPVHTRCTCAFRVNRPPWEYHRIPLTCSAPGACLQGSPKSFTERLNKCCDAADKETENGERGLPRNAYAAPGSHPPLLWKSGARCVAVVSDTPPPKRHRPSVEVLFQSGAEIAGLFVRS